MICLNRLYSVVTIPGGETLSESESAAVLKKFRYKIGPSRADFLIILTSRVLRQQQGAAPVNHELVSRLLYVSVSVCSQFHFLLRVLNNRDRDMTPPVDEQEAIEEGRKLESEARVELENEGCPPCYPLNVEPLLERPPQQFRAIISYWNHPGNKGDLPLRAQLKDWKEFRIHQQRLRRLYEKRNINTYIERLRERRRTHNLPDQVDIRQNLAQQSRLGNWTEYQDYHLIRLDRLNQKREDCARDLEAGRAYQSNLDYYDRNLEIHKYLRKWIEQQRRVMQRADLRCTEDKTGNMSGVHPRARSLRTRGYQQAHPKLSAALGKVRITKAKSRTTKARNHQPKISEPKSARPPGMTPLDGGAHKPRTQLARTHITTRSGRISKPPLRWAPT